MNKNARSIEKARNRTQIRFTEDSGVHSAAERIRQHKAAHSLRGDSSRPVAPQRSTTQPALGRKTTEGRRDSGHDRTHIRFTQDTRGHSGSEQTRQHKTGHSLNQGSTRPVALQRSTTQPTFERKKTEDHRDPGHRFSQFIPPQRMTTMPDLERKKSEHSVKRGDHHAKSKLKDWILAAKKKWQKKVGSKK
jgi:hypothetical protein